MATHSGKRSTTYFRKYLLGAISHGFDRYNSEWIWFDKSLGSGYWGIPDWEITLAKNLSAMDNYDDVIAFDWSKTCAVLKPGLAVAAGLDLAGQILRWMSLRTKHAGDVVDLHLIGHSRGAVVVTQALKYLVAKDPLLGGSYVQLTLLDPHPANISFEKQWADFAVDSDGKLTKLADLARFGSTHFQKTVVDPRVYLPKGIKEIDIWYQQNLTSSLTGYPNQADIMNLWGLVSTGGLHPAIQNRSGLILKPIDLTTHDPAVAHNQVPDLYEKQVVESGSLNRRP
jgi:hypothetical protein